MFLYPSTDLCIDTIPSQRSTDSSLDFIACLFFFYSYGTFYINRVLSRLIYHRWTPTMFKHTWQMISANRLHWAQFWVSWWRLWIFMYMLHFCFLFLIILQELEVFDHFDITGYCLPPSGIEVRWMCEGGTGEALWILSRCTVYSLLQSATHFTENGSS